MTKRQEKRWDNYLAIDGRKTVLDLTEAEAKDELCKAMRAIEKMRRHVFSSNEIADAWSMDRKF